LKVKLYYDNYSLSFIDFMVIFYTSHDQSPKLYQFAKELDLGLNLRYD